MEKAGHPPFTDSTPFEFHKDVKLKKNALKEVVFAGVYSSTPKQIKMSTPLATCKAPFGEKKSTADRG